MVEDIASAVAEFVQQGGEIRQLPDQTHPKIGPRKSETRFHFNPTNTFIPDRGEIRTSYGEKGKNWNSKEQRYRQISRMKALRRQQMHGEIAYRKRQERLSTISRY